jgi:hypothetical protein
VQENISMALTYAKIQAFVRKNGKVVSVKPTSEVKILPTGDVDSVDLVETAARYLYEGRSYTTAEFEKLVDSST